MGHGPAKGPGHGGPASGIPARGYSYEPFEAGNLVPVRHGARSLRLVDPVAASLADALRSAEALDRIADIQQRRLDRTTEDISPVSWFIEWRGGDTYGLRNLGPERATAVQIDPESRPPVSRAWPDGVEIDPNQSHRFPQYGILGICRTAVGPPSEKCTGSGYQNRSPCRKISYLHAAGP